MGAALLPDALRDLIETESSPDKRARAFIEVWMESVRSGKHKHTSLDRLSLNVGLANARWYQAQLVRRAEADYTTQGLAFLQRVKDAFPPSAIPVPVDETPARLEKISPGFIAWAKDLADQAVR